MTEETLSAALEREHRDIDGGIEEHAAQLNDSCPRNTKKPPTWGTNSLVGGFSSLCARGDLNPHVLANTGT